MLRLALIAWLALCSCVQAQMNGGVQFPGPGLSAASGFTPASISNLVAWYKADSGLFTDTAGTTPAVNGNTVARWNDNSGNGYNLLQATSGKRPALNTSGLGASKPAVVCAQPSATSMQTASGVALSGVPLTVVIVAQLNNATDNFGRLLAYNQAASPGDFQSGSWVMSRNATNNEIRADSISSAFFDYGALSLATTYFLSFTRDASFATAYKSNVQYTQLASSNNSTVTGGILGVCEFLTGGAPGGSSYWDGPISEILIYSKVLNGTELGNIQTYLAARW